MISKLFSSLNFLLSIIGGLIMAFFLQSASSVTPILSSAAPYALTAFLSFYFKNNKQLTGGILAMLIVDILLVVPVVCGIKWEYTLLFSLWSMTKLLTAFPLGALGVWLSTKLYFALCPTRNLHQ